jgi:hypothetical protein
MPGDHPINCEGSDKASMRHSAACQTGNPIALAEEGQLLVCRLDLNLRIRRLTNPEGKPVALTVAEYALLTAFLPSRRCSMRQLLIDMTVSRSWRSPERYSPSQRLSVDWAR